MYKSFKTPVYGTFWEYGMKAERACTPEEYRVDHALVEMLLTRLGCGTVLRVGFSKAIFDRKFYILDPTDYSRCTIEKNGEIWIPASYAYQYFGADLTEDMECYASDENGYVNLNHVCTQMNRVSMTYDRGSGLVIVTPHPVYQVSPEKEPKFIERMAYAFEDPMMPEPKYNTSEQTRKVLDESFFPEGEYDWVQKRYTNLYSPAILVTKDEKGRTVYYVAYEICDTYGGGEFSTDTALLRSYDRGETWERAATLNNVRWAYLFEVKGTLYLCGTRFSPSNVVVIGKLDGNTFRVSVFESFTSQTNTNFILIKNDRIYLPTFPKVMSADINSDLLKESSWQISNSLDDVTDREWFFKETGAERLDAWWLLEGNIVEGRDGRIFDMLRIECQPNNGYAALLEVSEDGTTLTREAVSNGIVEMPTTVAKFCVRYDEATGLYLTLCNYPSIPMPVPTLPGAHPLAGHRNILCLAASPDLLHWKVLDVLLCDREVMNAAASARAHGFQYAYWDTDGDDLIYVVREAVGYTKCFHDGKYLTFYRLKNYKRLVKERYEQTEFWSNPNRKKQS